MRQLAVSEIGVFLLLLPGWVSNGTVSKDHGHQNNVEHEVEHEVEGRDALYAARELFRSRAPARSGCSQCSSQDMDYCLGQELLQDHCCCDLNQPERFPYIPHVCYQHELPLCQPTAADCEEFHRLDVCCCQPYLRPQWQYQSWKSSTERRRSTALLTILLILALGAAG